MKKDISITPKKPGRPRKNAETIADTRKQIDQYKESFTNKLPQRQRTPVQEKSDSDFTEALAFLSSGHFDIHKSCEMLGRNYDWFRMYLNTHPLQKPMYEQAKEKAKENSLAMNVLNATNAYTKLITGYEKTKIKKIYDVNENNSAITYLTSVVKETTQIGPNVDLVKLTLNKLTPRFATINSIQVGKILLEFVQLVANKGLPVEELINIAKEYILEKQSNEDES